MSQMRDTLYTLVGDIHSKKIFPYCIAQKNVFQSVCSLITKQIRACDKADL